MPFEEPPKELLAFFVPPLVGRGVRRFINKIFQEDELDGLWLRWVGVDGLFLSLSYLGRYRKVDLGLQ